METATFRLRLLGGFALSYGEEPLRVARPGQRLLAHLAVCHKRMATPRTLLAEVLWPDTAPDRAATNLRAALWRLPRPRGLSSAESVSASVRIADHVRVDLWEAEETAMRICSEAVTDQVAVDEVDLTADLLPEWGEEWLLVPREDYRQKRLHALEHTAGMLCGQGRFLQALVAGLSAVRAEPLRESAHRRVIEVHLAEGNHAEALRHYDSYRRMLATELGLPPSPALRRLVGPLLGRPLD